MSRRIEYVDIDSVEEFEGNPKDHRIDLLTDSIYRFGFTEPLLLDERTGLLISGHGRLTTIRKMRDEGQEPPEGISIEGGSWAIPVVKGWASRSDEDAKAALIALNKTSEIGGWVDEDLLVMLDELAEIDTGLVGVGFDDDSIEQLRRDLENLSKVQEFDDEVERPSADEADDTFLEPDLDEEAITRPGDVWMLGPHRLVCGDSQDQSVVDLAVVGGVVDMVWTDPPYGVAIGDKNKWLDSFGTGNKSGRVKKNLENDAGLSEDELEQFLGNSLGNAFQVTKPGGVWQVAAPPGPLHLIFGRVLNDLGVWRQTIQWVKNNSTFSPLGVHYHWKAEPIFHGWKPGAASQGPLDRTQTTVWEIDRPQKSADHPTMKPVALVQRGIENHTDPGQLIYDPFLGSGTTLLAAEVSGRVCAGVELSPNFCDVICRRYQELTGNLPIRQGEDSGTDFLGDSE